MPQIQFLSREQEALIPEYQEKWRRIYLTTQPIERLRAEAAVKGAYAVMSWQEPEVMFCSSPRAALEYLATQTPRTEAPQTSAAPSEEEIRRNFTQFFLRSAWEAIKLSNKQRRTGVKPLRDLLKELSNASSKAFGAQIERCLPKDLTTQEIVEQAVLGSTPLFNQLGKERARRGEPGFQNLLQDRPLEGWQDSFQQTASAVEAQLSWLPAKGFLFRGWLKQYLQSALSTKIFGLDHPQLQQTLFAALPASQKMLLFENSPVIISDLAIYCILLDFSFSVLNYPHPAKKWAALQGLVKHCGWIFATQNLCIVCDRPTQLRLDEDYQLHAEGEPAVQFADGFAAYARHGILLPETYGAVHPSQWQPQWILAERNPELQQVLAQAIGAVRLCRELPIVELSTLQNYSLLKLEDAGSKTISILRRIQPETGEVHAVFIPQPNRSIESAIEYAHQNFSAEDFPMPL